MNESETVVYKWQREPGRMYELCPRCGYAKKIFYGWKYCPMCGARLERDA